MGKGNKGTQQIKERKKYIILYVIFNEPCFISNKMGITSMSYYENFMCLGPVQACGIVFTLPVVESREP